MMDCLQEDVDGVPFSQVSFSATAEAGGEAGASLFAVPVQPDPKQAMTFFAALLRGYEGVLHFRAVPEPARVFENGRREPPKNLHYAMDGNFANTIEGFLNWCNIDQRAAFFLPGFVTPGGTGKADVQAVPVFLVDFDKGDPAASLAELEAAIGPATVIVESGGMTGHGCKLHAYWRLAQAATGADIDTLCAAREAAAVRFNGDPAFKQPAQVIRVPGSVHRKGAPVLVRLRTVRPEAEYTLEAIHAALGVTVRSTTAGSVGGPDWFDFNTANANPHDGTVDRALTAPVHEGGVDEMTRFEAAGKAIGHFIRMIRDGKMTEPEAWDATKNWNTATLVPAWDEDRLRNDFERLLRIDIDAKGPFIPAAPAITPERATNPLSDWFIKRFKIGQAPQRRWLVADLIPLGTVGVFAAVGDAGKSMLSLKLALQVACAPHTEGPMRTPSSRAAPPLC